METAIRRHQAVAVLDGLADLSAGVATRTDDLRDALAAISTDLAEPLEMSNCVHRATAFAAAIGAKTALARTSRCGTYTWTRSR
jgi:hypothetical protein